MDDALLGDEHGEVVGRLLDRIDAVSRGELSPRVLVLEGASGTGKSRIVREIYRTLQARQSPPAYWPQMPESRRREYGGGSGSDPMPDRKRLGPPLMGFVWPAGALPQFSWWVLDCDRMPRGDLIDVIGQARSGLEAHLVPARLAWREAVGWPSTLGMQRSRLIELAKESAIEGGLEGAEAFLASFSVVVPGLGLGLSWLNRALRAYSKHQSDQGALSSDVRLGGEAAVEQMSAAAELANLILQVAHPRVPGVVVVEDIHLLGSNFAEFLEIVARRQPQQPLIVIGTAWPEGRQNPDYDRWLRQTEMSGNLERLQMPVLQQFDLIEFIRREAPATTDRTALTLADRLANPLALQLYLSLEDTQDQIRLAGGCLDLSPQDLDDLPTEIHELYVRRWRELPYLFREVLSYASGALPHNQPRSAFLVGPLTEAVASITTIDAATVRQVLEDVANLHCWTIVDADGTQRFQEGVLAEIAGDGLSKLKRAAIRSAVRAELISLVDQRREGYWLPADDAVDHAARWLSEMSSPNGLTTTAEAVALVHTAFAHASAHQPSKAAQTLEDQTWLKYLDQTRRDTQLIRISLGNWLVDAGKVERGLALLVSVYSDQRRLSVAANSLGLTHHDTLALLNNIARAYEVAGDFDRAISLYERSTAALERVFGGEHPDTLTSLNNLGVALTSAGKLSRAIEVHEQVLAGRERALGPNHADTLASRNNLAYAVQSAGKLDRAISLHEKTLGIVEQVMGADHPQTLTLRNNLALAIGGSGNLKRAMEIQVQVLADREKVLGPVHPDTLASRNNVGQLYQASGQFDRALEIHEDTSALLDDALGPDHPLTLSSRNNLAISLESTGDLHGAINLFNQVLGDRERVLGTKHPDTLVSVNNLARALEAAGDLNRAMRLYEQTYAGLEQGPGPEDPRTLTSKSNLAVALAAAGRLDRAISLHREVLTDRERILGDYHPETLTSRNNLAYTLQLAGDLDEAESLFEQNLVDRQRVLGLEHPDSLTWINNLCNAMEAAGHFDRVVALLDRTLTDFERFFGLRHPKTLNIRFKLAEGLEEVGRLDEAVPLFEQILADRERDLGVHDPATAATRIGLARALSSRGELNRAVVLFEEALTSRELALGPDHPLSLGTRHELAYAYLSARSFRRAIELYEQAVAGRGRLLGPQHPHTLASRHGLADAVARDGDMVTATQLFMQVLADCELVLGLNHPNTLIARQSLGVVYESVGNLALAVPLYERNLAERLRVLGPDHADTLASRECLRRCVE